MNLEKEIERTVENLEKLDWDKFFNWLKTDELKIAFIIYLADCDFYFDPKELIFDNKVREFAQSHPTHQEMALQKVKNISYAEDRRMKQDLEKKIDEYNYLLARSIARTEKLKRILNS